MKTFTCHRCGSKYDYKGKSYTSISYVCQDCVEKDRKMLEPVKEMPERLVIIRLATDWNELSFRGPDGQDWRSPIYIHEFRVETVLELENSLIRAFGYLPETLQEY